ncbi:hypothetical protein FDP41_008127 [Naegleria fowleri]|uniref:RGS domain-containing protein n=1 Tax=Naegleria fowleri TaxID=5763 RepID=A0A6A5B2Y8_NAEFO|nr:uncharacterized protein FDP41_008127 [Naegleria fowleri]KAF0973423.1 hypothetical protein FDP41_008127 [Naegleria fowleri]
MFASTILRALTISEESHRHLNNHQNGGISSPTHSSSPPSPSSSSPFEVHRRENSSPFPMMKSQQQSSIPQQQQVLQSSTNTTFFRKKRMDSKNHIIDIHMRPNLERIISNEKTLQCFRYFADQKQVLESLDCLVEIKKYKKLLEPLMNGGGDGDGHRRRPFSHETPNIQTTTSRKKSTSSLGSHSSGSEKTLMMTNTSQHQGQQFPNMEVSGKGVAVTPTSPSSTSNNSGVNELRRLSSPRSPLSSSASVQQVKPSMNSSSGKITQLGRENSTQPPVFEKDHDVVGSFTVVKASSPTSTKQEEVSMSLTTQQPMTNSQKTTFSEKRFKLNSLLTRKSSPVATSPTTTSIINLNSSIVTSPTTPTTGFGNNCSENQNWTQNTNNHENSLGMVNGVHQESTVGEEEKLFHTTHVTNEDIESVTSDNTASTTNSDTILHPSATVKIYEKAYLLMIEIMDNFLRNGADSEINIDGQSKHRLFGNAALQNMQSYIDMDLLVKYILFDQVELELLLLVKEDILPRFAQSEIWQNFVLENGDVANSCCYPEDVEKVLKLRYRKEDLLREYITQKDLDFSEMAASDMSCLKHMLDVNSLNIFSTKGDQFVDIQDIGMGGFTNAKIIGFLPFSAEVVISGHCSGYAMTKFVPTTLFDQDKEGKIVSFREHEFEQIDFSKESNKDVYPSWLTKFSVKYPRPFTNRTCYAAGTCVYVKGRYIMINKAILNPEKYPSEYIYRDSKKSKMKKKKTTNSLFVSIHVVTPVAKEKCHFVNLLLLNTGGFLNILAEALLEQSLKVCSQQQMTMISELNEMKKDRYAMIEDGYLQAKRFISLSLAKFGKTISTAEGCTFPQTFEEFQKYADA